MEELDKEILEEVVMKPENAPEEEIYEEEI